jgi:hypothetical protein
MLSELGVALTVLIVLVAFRRLSLYEEAYGFTMLRLYSHIFAVWVGLVFVLLAADLTGAWQPRRWLLGSTLLTALLTAMALNIANPEALVVRLNASRAQSTHKLDAEYVKELSSDAVPSLLNARSALPQDLRSEVTRATCPGSKSYTPGWAAFNLAAARAAEAKAQHC